MEIVLVLALKDYELIENKTKGFDINVQDLPYSDEKHHAYQCR